MLRNYGIMGSESHERKRREGFALSCRFSPQAKPYVVTPVDNLFLCEYMPRATGFQVQVYLYGLLLCYNPEAAGADSAPVATALGASEEDVLNAFAYWQGEGLVRIISDTPLTVEYLCLRFNGYARTEQVPGQYYKLVQSLQMMLAPRSFSGSDLRHVIDWMEVFGLEEGAVLELVGHCVELKGKRVGVKYMDAVARAWADANVLTAKEARAHILTYRELTGGAAAVLKRWRIRRSPTEDELNLYRVWTKEWGFSDESILAACPATLGAGNPSFSYLNGVLDRMRRQGLTAADEVDRELSEDAANLAVAREVFARAGIAGSPDLKQRTTIAAFVQKWGMPLEVVLMAAEQAAGKRDPFAYLKKIMNNWQEQGIHTPEAAAEQIKNKKPASRTPKGNKALEYPQRVYTDDELAHLFVDLNKTPGEER